MKYRLEVPRYFGEKCLFLRKQNQSLFTSHHTNAHQMAHVLCLRWGCRAAARRQSDFCAASGLSAPRDGGYTQDRQRLHYREVQTDTVPPWCSSRK